MFLCLIAVLYYINHMTSPGIIKQSIKYMEIWIKVIHIGQVRNQFLHSQKVKQISINTKITHIEDKIIHTYDGFENGQHCVKKCPRKYQFFITGTSKIDGNFLWPYPIWLFKSVHRILPVATAHAMAQMVLS